MQRTYSRTSFASNWCEENWPELFHLRNHQIYKKCFARYKDPQEDIMRYNELFKFIVHYIAAVPELIDIKYELDDNPTYEIVVESIADDLIKQLLFQCKIAIPSNKKELIIDETTFTTNVIIQLGTAKLVRNRRHTLSNVHAHRTAYNKRRKKSMIQREERMKIFYRKINSSNGKSSDRGGNSTTAIIHDDIVSYRRVFEDILILYPCGQMLKQYRTRMRKDIVKTILIDQQDRNKQHLDQIIKWITPALNAHKIPTQSDSAYHIAAHLKLMKLKEKNVVFLAGEQAKLFYIILQGSVAVFDGTLYDGNHVFTLQNGSGFGGLALASDEPQTNSCMCSSDCLLGILTKEDYNKFMQPSYEPNPKEKYKTLKRCGLLKWTPEHLLKELSLFAMTKYYPRNSLILQQGDIYEDGVYFIKSGTVKIIRELPNGVFVNVNKLGHSETFGWECLLTSFSSLSSVVAETKVVLYLIQKSHLLHKLDHKSLQHIYNNLGNFPSDLEFADQLLLSQKWFKYRNNIFDQVKQSRNFRTQRIKQKDKGALTTSLNLSPFPFDPNEKLDVEIEKKDVLTKVHATKQKKWQAVKAMFHTSAVMRNLHNAVNDTILESADKNKYNNSLNKIQILSSANRVVNGGSNVEENGGNKRPSTPRSFRIITQRNKHKYNYYRYRQKPKMLKLPGYSWLNSDQQKSVLKQYKNSRESWLIQSNAEEEEKQKTQKKLFDKMKANKSVVSTPEPQDPEERRQSRVQRVSILHYLN